MILYFAGSVAISLVLFITLALFFRKALRGLWRDHELLKKSLVDFQNNNFDRYRKLYGDIAGLLLKMDNAVPFRAQHGEDIILWNFFNRKISGFFIEVGAFDGDQDSNTYAFEKLGWNGILIEAGQEQYKECLANRPGSKVIHAAVGGPDAKGTITFHQVTSSERWGGMLSYLQADERQSWRVNRTGTAINKVEVPYRSLNDILKTCDSGPIDFITIDVEGGELDVLKGFDINKYHPRVIVVENNNRHEHNRIEDYLKSFDFQLRFSVGCNDFYLGRGDKGVFVE